MPDTFQPFTEAKPGRFNRSRELRKSAILNLALKSLNDVKAAQDASWPCRVRPTDLFASEHDAPLRRNFSS
jgi:hypothetical protein